MKNQHTIFQHATDCWVFFILTSRIFHAFFILKLKQMTECMLHFSRISCFFCFLPANLLFTEKENQKMLIFRIILIFYLLIMFSDRLHSHIMLQVFFSSLPIAEYVYLCMCITLFLNSILYRNFKVLVAYRDMNKKLKFLQREDCQDKYEKKFGWIIVWERDENGIFLVFTLLQ